MKPPSLMPMHRVPQSYWGRLVGALMASRDPDDSGEWWRARLLRFDEGRVVDDTSLMPYDAYRAASNALVLTDGATQGAVLKVLEAASGATHVSLNYKPTASARPYRVIAWTHTPGITQPFRVLLGGCCGTPDAALRSALLKTFERYRSDRET